MSVPVAPAAGAGLRLTRRSAQDQDFVRHSIKGAVKEGLSR